MHSRRFGIHVPPAGVRVAGAVSNGTAAGVTSGGTARVSHSEVVMHVLSNFDDQFRPTAWVAINVTLANSGNAAVSGVVEVPDLSSAPSQGLLQTYSTLYQAPVTLPPGTSKRVTLYLPGSDVGSGIVARFRVNGRNIATARDEPFSFDAGRVSVGVLTGDPSSAVWVRQSRPGGSSPIVVRLNNQSLDLLPQALASLDVIALTHTASSTLDRNQFSTLEQYVRAGGTLLMVGGPDWQETLAPLPTGLVPGTLSPSQPASGLSGLRALDGLAPKAGRTTLSVLSHPTGTVLASQGSVPLLVQSSYGSGRLLYLGFDPAVAPIASWSGSGRFLTHLMRLAAPEAMSRAGLTQASVQIPFLTGFEPTGNLELDLASLPAAALPPVLLFALLTVLYILVIGPGNFLLLRRLHRRELAWVTVPVLAALCIGATFGVAGRLKASTVLVNTIGVLRLDGSAIPHQLSMYAGLFAPVSGDYVMTYNGPALPAAVTQVQNASQPTAPGDVQNGLQVQEGNQTQVRFLSMNKWSIGDVGLHTAVSIHGHIQSQLHIDADGYIMGSVRNATHLPLVHVAIIAGKSFVRLADLPPQAVDHIRLKPGADLTAAGESLIWAQVYGSSANVEGYYPGNVSPSLSRVCCYSSPQAPARSLLDRIRNAVADMPEAQAASGTAEVFLAAWTQQSIGSISVDGSRAQRRDLTLVTAPLSVTFPHGPFTLLSGVLGARLVDESPQPALNNSCCTPGIESTYLGKGGRATFQFQVPRASHVHWRSLSLGVNAGGASGAALVSVFDWRTSRWVSVDMSRGYAAISRPASFVSSTGAVLVRLQSTAATGEIHIDDPYRDLQLNGAGVGT
ncbi:MAG: hypothetical protein ACRDFX_01965 [Chloroflexota bacterium]